MVIPRKRNPSLPLHYLTLGGSELERVKCIKYLGLVFSETLSFSEHIQSICTRAKRLIGLLYRRFYNNIDGATMLQLYQSLVRPHLEYASPVWNPHTQKDIKMLESVEKFAIKMSTKNWNIGYHDLLSLTHVHLLPLETRRVYSSLCMIFHHLCYFTPNIICQRYINQRTNNHSLLHQPFARTNAFFHSFVPRTINIWNTLY